MTLKQVLKKNSVLILCSFSLLAVLATSCGKSSNNINREGDSHSNLLNATVVGPTCDDSINFCFYEQLPNQSASTKITFTPSVDSVSGLKITFPTSDDKWTTDCPNTTISGSVTCTITYSPANPVVGKHDLVPLTYTYVNNLKNTITSNTPIKLNYKGASLLDTGTSLPPQIDLTEATQVTFYKSQPSFWLISVLNDYTFHNELFKYDINNVVNYTTAFNKIVIKNNNNLQGIAIYNPPSSMPKKFDNIYAYSPGKSLLYGCNQIGEIYSLNLLKEPIQLSLLTTLSSPNMIMSCLVDTSSTSEAIYSLSKKSGDTPGDEFLCMTSTNTNHEVACYQSALGEPLAVTKDSYQPNIMAANGIFYIKSQLDNESQISAFTSKKNSTGKTILIPYPDFKSTPIPSVSSLPMVYDSINKIIYVVVEISKSNKAESSYLYQLHAIDANNGANKLLKEFSAEDEKISAPFITKTGNVIIVSSAGKVYGFKKDGTGVFTTGAPYNLPISSPMIDSVNLDSTTSALDIPIKTNNGTSVYALNIDW